VFALLALTAAPSWAAGGSKLCVPKAEGAALVTPKHGKCRKGYKLTLMGAEGKAGVQGKAGADGKQGPEGKTGPEGKAGFTPEQAEQLKALLPYLRFVGKGVAGKPTVQFSGVNVQVVNGEGKTQTTNGVGNLVIGYDENESAAAQTGSHDLIVGIRQQYSSYGGLVAGEESAITAPFASVSGGKGGKATGEYASVSGGAGNTASALYASISGGYANTASGLAAAPSISGGWVNTASASYASISGGKGNTASGYTASVSGGESNSASGQYASVSGGLKNASKGNYSSVLGGHLEEATALYEHKP
jgi:hypothetical protein